MNSDKNRNHAVMSFLADRTAAYTVLRVRKKWSQIISRHTFDRCRHSFI